MDNPVLSIEAVQRWQGYVYLEVFLEDHWSLLDAVQRLLYEEYDPTQRLLPGVGVHGLSVERYAYDKGGDPHVLVLSLDWDRWHRETETFFGNFDLQLLNRARSAVKSGGRLLTA